MSRPHEPDHVKLILSLFSPERALIQMALSELSDLYGRVDRQSPELLFDRTKYYEKEMGWPLYRRFISFEELVPPDCLAEIKLITNQVERRYLKDDNRLINIDPGFISPERLILATGKNYIHRIYLSKGIYADLTLIFERGSFVPLKWTYRDYADPEIIEFFNGIREGYMKQRKRYEII